MKCNDKYHPCLRFQLSLLTIETPLDSVFRSVLPQGLHLAGDRWLSTDLNHGGSTGSTNNMDYILYVYSIYIYIYIKGKMER